MELNKCKAEDLERVIGFSMRDKSGATPNDFLKQFLAVSRQYAFATNDDSWGELEKELQTVFRNYERYQRFIDLKIAQFISENNQFDYDSAWDHLMDLGETAWNIKRVCSIN